MAINDVAGKPLIVDLNYGLPTELASPTPDIGFVEKFNAEVRRNNLVNRGWYYPFVILTFLVLSGAFVGVIVKSPSRTLVQVAVQAVAQAQAALVVQAAALVQGVVLVQVAVLVRAVPVVLVGNKPTEVHRTSKPYLGTNSIVVATRVGSANPSTHFCDPFVLYFSPNAAVISSSMRAPRTTRARTRISRSPT